MMRRLHIAVVMTARETVRNRTACVLAFLLPVLFYALTLLMTSERIVVFQLASVSLEPDVEAPARSETFVFMALVAIGFMSAFFGVNLIQKHSGTNRRLVICGYRPSELVLSKLLVLAGSVVIVSLYCLALMTPFFVPHHPASVFIGVVLVGYVYGCYGLMVGAMWRRELECMFSVILLTTIDVGWLQNPVFYTEAENKTLIHWLPAYWPMQVAMGGAFTDHGVSVAVLGALSYGTALLGVAIVVFWRQVRLRVSPTPSIEPILVDTT
jgi:ABC-2 type transport system permease protein